MHESTRYVNFSKPECAKGVVVLENYARNFRVLGNFPKAR